MQDQQSASEVEGSPDDEQDYQRAQHSILDEDDGKDDDAGADHGVGNRGDDFKRAISSLLHD